MKIFGKPIAEALILDLKEEISLRQLKPRLAVILAGDHPASRIYIKHKILAAEKAGIQLNLYSYGEDQRETVTKKITELNNDASVHGIIVQLPLYQTWNVNQFVNAVLPEKDVDGFLENSPYTAATAAAIWEMIAEFSRIEKFESPEKFLTNMNIVVLGKGKTAGKPTRELLAKKGFESKLIDSKTENPDEIIRHADLIISATGRKNIINAENLKDNAYVIGVGVGKETIDGEEKIFGDIDEHAIKNIAKLYCPTIGGIGPLTVACLLRNVVESAKKQNHK